MPTRGDHELALCRFKGGTPGALYDIGVGPKSERRKRAAVYPHMQVGGCELQPVQYEVLRKAKLPGTCRA